MTKQELIQRLQKEIDAVQNQPDNELFTCLIEIDSAQQIVETYYSDYLLLDDPNWSMTQEQKQAVVDQYYEALNERFDDQTNESMWWVMEKLELAELFGDLAN